MKHRPHRLGTRACMIGLLWLTSGELTGCDSREEAPPPAEHETETAQAPPTSGEWTPPAETERQAAEVSESDFTGAGRVLPRPQELPGWHYIEVPVYYDDTNLSELIDGGAVAYIQAGLEQTAYAVLEMDEQPEAVGRAVGLEIYVFDMSSPEAAQTKFDADHETGTCTQVAEIRGRHCQTSSSLDALIGPYYLRLVLDSDHPDLAPHLRAAALPLVARVEAATATPSEGTGQ